MSVINEVEQRLTTPNHIGTRIDNWYSTTLAVLAEVDLNEIKPCADEKHLRLFIGIAIFARLIHVKSAGKVSIAPLVDLCDVNIKYKHRLADPARMFDLASDPDEMQNLTAELFYEDKNRAFQ